MKDEKGSRIQHFFLASEVRRLSYFLKALSKKGKDDNQDSE